MARIRSIHPGIFTDEAFMSASAHARVLLIGLWCEAWDDGVFEWKPLTLKARIFPADNVDMAGLLAELVTLNVICQFNAKGKAYGAVRNFQKFQRPKKPNSSGVLTAEIAAYVGTGTEPATDDNTPVPNQFGTSSEKSSQMEDGEGEEEKKTLQQQPSLVAAPEAAAAKGRRQELDDLTAKLTEAAWLDPGCAANPGFAVLAPILGLIDGGYSLDEDILPVLRAKRHQATKARGWAFYVEAIREARARRLEIAATPAPKGRDLTNPFAKMLANGWQQKPEHYDQLCKSWFTRKSWPDPDVPVPGKEGSFVPLEHVERWLRANRKLIVEAA